MKCTHCNEREATTHIRKNINGTKTEMHLCSECAAELGVMDEFRTENFFNDSFFGSLLGAGIPAMNLLSGIERCETCGSTFNDIVKSGKVGCANCYSKFADKLEPSIVKLHGKANHIGKNVSYTEVEDEAEPEVNTSADSAEHSENSLHSLKRELKQAIKEQRFEDAAVLRDKIKEISQEG